MSEKHIGEVVQVIGPVLDIRFAHDELPPLHDLFERIAQPLVHLIKESGTESRT